MRRLKVTVVVMAIERDGERKRAENLLNNANYIDGEIRFKCRYIELEAKTH